VLGSAPAADATSMETPRIVRHRVFRYESFLAPAEVDALAARVFALEDRFVPSFTSDHDDDYRRSFVLDPPGDLQHWMIARVRRLMPEVLQGLGVSFPVGTIECQVTANTDGSFFRIHTDAGDNETWKRELTYVYYFNRLPLAFSGGELLVYDDEVRNGKLARRDTFQTIAPLHNSIVFFHARVMHEVTPVAVPSKAFRDSRFTVNGWVQRT
jgi:Rps23 Pro-64 3,4-dihydroxylase Tpa1-like proline 4-hydroxylase